MAAWKGGKARLAARLIPLFPPHRCYVEPFGGMASVLLNKPRAKTEIYNDRDRRLVSLFAVVKYHPEAVDRELAGLLKSRVIFETFKQSEDLTDIQNAARFLYLQSLSYGARGAHFGTGTKRGGTSVRTVEAMRAMLARLAQRLQPVTIEWLDYEVCIEKYDSPETFFYCDPPYWGAEGYCMPFGADDQRALAARLRRIRGKFLVTNADTQEVRQLYRGFRIQVLAGPTSLPRSDRARPFRHLVITNYPPRKGP